MKMKAVSLTVHLQLTMPKKYDDAIKFYDMAIQKGYKADDAYVGKAMSLRSQDKAADFYSNS